MSAKAITLENRYNAKLNSNFNFENIFHANAFNFPLWGIITSENSGELSAYRWGLVPRWTKSFSDAQKIRKNTLNARSETIFEKPSFKYAIKKQRCLIPSTGFFEWRDENKKKIPYFIKLKETEIFSIAGIYENWTNKENGEIISTFSILTTKANPLMEFIHNTNKRMPLILNIENENKWLDNSLDENEINELCKPFEENIMEAYTISPDFLKKAFDDESIINKI